MADVETTVDNGVNVQALLDARVALESAPEAAQFQWRASCKWKNGTHSYSTVEGYFGLGEQHKQKIHSISMPITPRCSRLKTKAQHRSNTCWSDSPVA